MSPTRIQASTRSRAVLDLVCGTLSPGQLVRLRRDAAMYDLVQAGWPVDELAETFGVSERHVMRRIKRFAGLVRG